jgi:hypothetical protein
VGQGGIVAGAAIGLAEVAVVLGVLAGATHPADAGRATLNLVLVLDGLRPDAITPEETPNLWRLRQEGVNFTNSHAVFPTVTRVNATAIATGSYPDRNGILGNRIYVRAVDPNHAFVNDDHRNLLRLDEVTGGGMVLVKSLAEILAERGKRLAAVSSGSTGSALLLNPRAPKGVGVLVNGYWEPGVRVAFPSGVNETVLERFGTAPARGALASEASGQRGDSMVRAHSASEDARERAGDTRPEPGSSARVVPTCLGRRGSVVRIHSTLTNCCPLAQRQSAVL